LRWISHGVPTGENLPPLVRNTRHLLGSCSRGSCGGFRPAFFCRLGLTERIAHRIDLLPQGRLTKRFRDVVFHRHNHILPQASEKASQVLARRPAVPAPKPSPPTPLHFSFLLSHFRFTRQATLAAIFGQAQMPDDASRVSPP
jgi:hypothetical protein